MRANALEAVAVGMPTAEESFRVFLWEATSEMPRRLAAGEPDAERTRAAKSALDRLRLPKRPLP